MTGLAYALALLTGLGLAQCLAGWILVARFAARVTTPPARFPPVTILKPLCGDDCLGLCAQCGKNLNEGSCQCAPEPPIPTFRVVQGLKRKNGGPSVS